MDSNIVMDRRRLERESKVFFLHVVDFGRLKTFTSIYIYNLNKGKYNTGNFVFEHVHMHPILVGHVPAI